MPDVRLIATPSRQALLAEFKGRLGHAVPGARLLAEGVLGAESSIDFVALEPLGRVVLVLVGDRGDDLELVARGIAQRAWVKARLRDWVQLAPLSGLSGDADVRVLLACPAFGAEAAAAIRAVGSEQLAAVSYRCVRNGAGFEVLVEHPFAMDEDASEQLPPVPAPEPAPEPGSIDLPEPPVFRTGLSDNDLGLSPEELREFE